MLPEVVIDTNVFIAGLRSRRGASFRLLELVGTGLFCPVLSKTLCYEYEDAGTRALSAGGMTQSDIRDVIDFLGAMGRIQKVYYRLRPALPDPGDEAVLELAFAAGSIPIVTFNTKDYRGSSVYGVRTLTPAEFLAELGVLA